MMNRLTISVCIGTYNRERYVCECIDSVLAQTRPADEIIIVDDASTDDTVKLVESYGDRVRLIKREKNSGNCAAARNDAIRASTCNYIAFLDSDDSWYPEKLEKQEAFFLKNPDVPLCHTYCEVMDAESKGCGVRHEGALRLDGDFDWLLEHCWISTSSVMFRKDLVDTIGFMNEDPRHRIGEDWEFYLRIAKHNPFGLVDEVLTRYRKSDAGISTTDWRHTPRSVISRMLLLERPDYWEGKVPRKRMVDTLVDACRDSSFYWRGLGMPDRSRWFCGVWLRNRPFDVKAWIELSKACLSRKTTSR